MVYLLRLYKSIRKGSVRAYQTEVKIKNYVGLGAPAEKLRERGLGDFGAKLFGLGIGPSALGSAGVAPPSPALGPALLTLAPAGATLAPAGVPNDGLLSG